MQKLTRCALEVLIMQLAVVVAGAVEAPHSAAGECVPLKCAHV